MDHETVWRADRGPVPDPMRSTEQLDRSEALRLLGTVPLGRIVFTHQALPAIRPVNHVVEGEDVIIRLDEGASRASLVATPGTPGIVLAYEADAIDPDTHLGWSVVVIGHAELVENHNEAERLEALLDPWTNQPMAGVLRIRAELVTGFRLGRQPRPISAAG
ncbi:pyridoxamine 5'-phosphate oxidase family protein [Streptomyces sp. SID1046]|uniref:pyridoxamine 5'-phosphate oxidase family protein n=1 Tax=Streptomyces sp. SID1046 TaxID=2690249 RepID=UPI0013700784|nr:pyridoxamine 5'-phosphate oxidase family protein [Streptomyces sp. SID1046]MYV79561.1 pyridoxamine 5'-phosphate oxidase family protein [Streptomyces sp. SID1046]